VFSPGHPRQYSLAPAMLNCADRTRRGVFIAVWPQITVQAAKQLCIPLILAKKVAIACLSALGSASCKLPCTFASYPSLNLAKLHARLPCQSSISIETGIGKPIQVAPPPLTLKFSLVLFLALSTWVRDADPGLQTVHKVKKKVLVACL
jgi:hypothetical protein